MPAQRSSAKSKGWKIGLRAALLATFLASGLTMAPVLAQQQMPVSVEIVMNELHSGRSVAPKVHFFQGVTQ